MTFSLSIHNPFKKLITNPKKRNAIVYVLHSLDINKKHEYNTPGWRWALTVRPGLIKIRAWWTLYSGLWRPVQCLDGMATCKEGIFHFVLQMKSSTGISCRSIWTKRNLFEKIKAGQSKKVYYKVKETEKLKYSKYIL